MTADPLARLTHAGEDGQPCAHHEAATLDAIFALATIGSSVSAFNHDIASKLQGLMMAVDMISELVESRADVPLQRATETALTALREANALLSANRALTRATTPTRTPLRALMERAGHRAGVAVHGDLPELTVQATPPRLVQGLGLALDAIAGRGTDRAVAVVAASEPGTVTLRFTTVPPPPRAASDLLALAAFVVRRDGGELYCARDARLVIRLGTL